ncbi:hypothetical protein TREMEDRAFT_40986 [Tremella mesenterica DSM 1558]|uniref:uncharacterized protein n=1 Tax=Tremella mesenterica (strain ATCC 24925 / CBS 8224 / DSM 1558 / NBRC 9311 / NRRL Y-6157 / RJB 2259-6 / UBC 559-6) TaxID=578456 RepID=UPI00032BC2A6|nr:uncharacterized protein TREMEDRAFT_40986 [Tremella mesenterica DSM 1558]EIW66338.1 hypothetical protein TREMEDRAFT_40986 [Tremella mesenterica DSM 1558]
MRIAYWDPRPVWATLREETLMERLHDISSKVKGHGFKVESWEVARKDGGVFLHFSYLPPSSTHIEHEEESEIGRLTGLPESSGDPYSPGKLFLEQLVESANKHGGMPSWIGQWWANSMYGQKGVAGHTIYTAEAGKVRSVVEEEERGVVKTGESGLNGVQTAGGGRRAWVVKGRQWTEDMNRFPSQRLRVEFDGPDVSQEMLYTLFRPYGRLHGYSTPTNTGDHTLRASGSDPSIPLSRLRIYYERPLKAHAVRDWISGHPRIALPVIAFLIGTLSYTFFDPIRAFFVRSKLEGVWDLEKYSVIKYLRSKLSLSSLGFRSSPPSLPDAIGKDAWQDRVEAEKSVQRWLAEYPSTFITITGPSGSGKMSLVTRVLGKAEKPNLVIDCGEIAKGKSDGAVVSALADQTGYYPVFSFLSSLNGLIDLASVGLIGQKAGFSTPVDQQLRQMLEIVGGALKDVSSKAREDHARSVQYKREQELVAADHARRREMIIRGGWHDGRLDCIAGNGPIAELGMGIEPFSESDLISTPFSPSTTGNPTASENPITPSTDLKSEGTGDMDIDAESEFIRTLPIVVLKNFSQKTAKGDLWSVLAEWGASLVDGRVAHVIVVTESAPALKSLTKALPAKPLNGVGLADADEENSLKYVEEKLKSGIKGDGEVSQESSSSLSKVNSKTGPKTKTIGSTSGLSLEDEEQIKKLGGRMVELETLVYKVRTGSNIKLAVEDIVLRHVVELRKAAFGDDENDAKGLPWNRSQAWKVVNELAKSGELSYASLLQNFPFKGAESALKAMEEHELVSIGYVDGRADVVRPGKPVFRYAFEALVNDPTFRASCQIDYNTALISTAQSTIKSCEEELLTLKDIVSGGEDKLGLSSGFMGLGSGSAVKERARWLLEKMGKSVEQLKVWEAENGEMIKVLEGKMGRVK